MDLPLLYIYMWVQFGINFKLGIDDQILDDTFGTIHELFQLGLVLQVTPLIL